MSKVECRFEAEALAAALHDRWPDHVDAELRAHVEACSICSDVLAIGRAFGAASEDLRADIEVPDASRVWWAAQLRARREAIIAAGRPITAAQLVALACAVGLFTAYLGATSGWLRTVLSRTTLFDWPAAWFGEHAVLILIMAALAFVVPTAVYVVLGKE